MAKPIIHANSSAKKFGGQPEDYIEIHDFMDSSKSVFPDNRHRALTHNSWFIFVAERVFGHTITVRLEDGEPCDAAFHLGPRFQYLMSPGYSDICDKCHGSVDAPNSTYKTKEVSVRDVCEQHILEDFGNKFIPTPQDYLEHMEFQPWMNNAVEGSPSSHAKIKERVRQPRERKRMLLD